MVRGFVICSEHLHIFAVSLESRTSLPHKILHLVEIDKTWWESFQQFRLVISVTAIHKSVQAPLSSCCFFLPQKVKSLGEIPLIWVENKGAFFISKQLPLNNIISFFSVVVHFPSSSVSSFDRNERIAVCRAHKSQRREQYLASARVVKRKWLYSFFFVPVVTKL